MKVFFSLIIALVTFSCGKNKEQDGTPGNAKLAMAKKTSLNLADPTLYTPSKLSIKFLNAYIVQDIDANDNNLGIGNYI